MIEIPKTLPHYLTTNHEKKNVHEVNSHPVTLTPNITFKDPSLKAIRSSDLLNMNHAFSLLGALK